jgi:tetratricopeptide (TPR) repeat protein
MITPKWGKIGLLIVMGIAVLMWGYSFWQNRVLDEKTVVLVANFDGPDQKNYRVTETILNQLTKSLAGYEDTIIIPLNQSIAEQDASNKARDYGDQYHADLVIWGWYGVTNTNAMVTIHIENMASTKILTLPKTETYVSQALIQEIEKFTLQEQLSNEMVSLVIFLKGVIRYDAKDFNSAIQLFTEAAAPNQWPADLIDEAIVYAYRANANMFAQNYQKTIDDYSQAITLSKENDPYLFAYYGNRGSILLLLLNEHQKGMNDLTESIRLGNQNAIVYNNRSAGYLLEGEFQKSLDDINQALKINPELGYAYFNRGQVYTLTGNYSGAIDDFLVALKYDQSKTLGYYGLCLANSSQKNYDEAIKNCNKFLELSGGYLSNVIDPRQKNVFLAMSYNNRGVSYLGKKDYELAISDFSQTIELSPEFAIAYFNRGHAYLLSGKNQQALEDYTKALELNRSTDSNLIHDLNRT